jgi:uncharacterized membrane protein
MNLPAALPPSWQWLGHALLAAIVAWAAWHAPWSRLRSNEGSHVFLGAIVLLTLLWSVAGKLGAAVHFHLLGATLACLMFGLPLAVLAVTAVAFLTAATGAIAWSSASLTALASGVLPVVISQLTLRTMERFLPRNYFVYLFVAAFFGAALAMLFAGGAAAALIDLGARNSWNPGADWVPMLAMLAFSEATLTGMLIALFVVYRPAWVNTFDDARYLQR